MRTNTGKSVLGNYRAKVLDNVDPLKVGRVKVEIYPFFRGINSELLPWAVPAMPIFNGAGSGSGCLCIPSIGSYVWVFFEAGDIYQPVYFAEAQTRLHGVPSIVQSDNYVGKKALKTSGNFQIVIDDTAKTITITHPDGASLKVMSNGKIQIANNTSAELLHLLQNSQVSPFINFEGSSGGNVVFGDHLPGREGHIKISIAGSVYGLRFFNWPF